MSDPVRDHLRRTAPDLLFAAGSLGRDARTAVGATWAVTHQLLDILDPVAPTEDSGCCGGETIERRAAVCESILDHLYRGEPTGKPELDAFKPVADQFNIDRAALSALIAARVQALSLRRFATWPRLRQSARQAAEPMMALLFAGQSLNDAKREQAAAWATSLFLTWELADVPRQFRAGRLILPLDDLVKFEVRESDVAGFVERGNTGGNERWAALIAHYADRLRLLHQGGSACLPHMRDNLGRCAASLGALTMARLDRLVRRRGDVFAAGLPQLGMWDRLTCLPRVRRAVRMAEQSR